MIFTLEARGNITLSVIQRIFKLNSDQCTKVILEEFEELNHKLDAKGIDYNKLKHALIPAHKEKREIAFIFDSTLIQSNWYGNEVFNWLLPVMNKQSTYSILCGDIIINNLPPIVCFSIIFENLVQYHETIFKHPTQYYVVYINNLTDSQIKNYINALIPANFFIGYVDMTFSNRLKTVLATTLVHMGIKHKNIFLLKHEDDRADGENVNCPGYDFKRYGFLYKSFSGVYFDLFLAYKIESDYIDTDDIKYSLNAIRIHMKSLKQIPLKVSKGKLAYLKQEKAGVLDILGLKKISAYELERMIKNNISKNYIYNLEFSVEHNVSKFNVSLEMDTVSKGKRKVLVALKFIQETNRIELITLY